MAQPKPNSESFPPPDRHADIIPFRGRGGEAMEPTEQQPARFYVEKWLSSGQRDQALATTILVEADTVGEADDEMHARLKAALRDSALYDHFDTICRTDEVVRSLKSRFHNSDASEGLTPVRKALLVLMDVRTTEVIKFPDQDITDQLAGLPLGNEERWIKLLRRL